MNLKKSMVWMLIFSVAWLGVTKPRAEAMLVPSAAEQPGVAINRSADVQTIEKTLESKAIRGRLHAMGLSDSEIQSRLSHLSDADVHQLASQIRAVNPAGGIIIGLLIFVVLVLLIIYLLKRIL